MRRALRYMGSVVVASSVSLTSQAAEWKSPYCPKVGNTAIIAVGTIAPARARAAELTVQLAWLADPSTAIEGLEAHVREGSLTLTGTVPSEEARAAVVRLARQTTSVLPVVDALQVQTGADAPAIYPPPGLLQQSVHLELSEAFPALVRGCEVQAQVNGRVILLGTVPSLEEKLALSQRIRHVLGCSAVDNKMRIEPIRENDRYWEQISADGHLRQALEMPAAHLPPLGVPVLLQDLVRQSNETPRPIAQTPPAIAVQPVPVAEQRHPIAIASPEVSSGPTILTSQTPAPPAAFVIAPPAAEVVKKTPTGPAPWQRLVAVVPSATPGISGPPARVLRTPPPDLLPMPAAPVTKQQFPVASTADKTVVQAAAPALSEQAIVVKAAVPVTTAPVTTETTVPPPSWPALQVTAAPPTMAPTSPATIAPASSPPATEPTPALVTCRSKAKPGGALGVPKYAPGAPELKAPKAVPVFVPAPVAPTQSVMSPVPQEPILGLPLAAPAASAESAPQPTVQLASAVTPSAEPLLSRSPEPLSPQVQSFLRSRITTACGGAARSVTIKFTENGSVWVGLRVKTKAIGQQLGMRVMDLPELAPFKVQMEVQITQ